jgi:hypothetical protein
MRGILSGLGDMVAEMLLQKQIRKMFLDCFLTVNQTVVRHYGQKAIRLVICCPLSVCSAKAVHHKLSRPDAKPFPRLLVLGMNFCGTASPWTMPDIG